MKKTEEEPRAKKAPRTLSSTHRALARIEALLEPLSHADRGRILDWLHRDWVEQSGKPRNGAGPSVPSEMGSGL